MVDLTDDELNAAVKDLVVKYPRRIVSNIDPPVNGQQYSLFSFNLFETPKPLRTGGYALGYVKERGNYQSEEQAEEAAKTLIKTTDSVNKIFVGNVGTWCPIVHGADLSLTKTDVCETEKEQSILQTKAQKELDQQNTKKISEIRTREADLKQKNEMSNEAFHDTIDFYIMKRNVILTLDKEIMIAKKKLADWERKRLLTANVCVKLESLHPEYNESVETDEVEPIPRWIHRYNEERQKSGTPNFIHSTESKNLYTELLKCVDVKAVENSHLEKLIEDTLA